MELVFLIAISSRSANTAYGKSNFPQKSLITLSMKGVIFFNDKEESNPK